NRDVPCGGGFSRELSGEATNFPLVGATEVATTRSLAPRSRFPSLLRKAPRAARFACARARPDNGGPPPPAARDPMTIQRTSDLDLRGKRVLIRQDLNVPVEAGKVTSDQRITASLPTLRAALDAGAAVMVMSHLGRPKEGAWSEADSLAPVAARLSELLGR